MCVRIGQDPLAECAELAVSELVTNAILHGKAPYRLQLSGTNDHPRFEVHDASTTAPQPSTPAGGFDIDKFDLDALSGEIGDEQFEAITTVGRGLDIVARSSAAWGAHIEEDGKAVWFEPAAEFSDEGIAEFQLTYATPPALDMRTQLGQIAVQVNGVPVDEWGRFQRHYRDLRREIRLLGLAHEETYPLAKVLTDHFDTLEAPLRSNMGRELVDKAAAAGHTTINLRLRMPAASAREIGGLIDLLDAADDFSRAERLLTPPRTPQQRSFQIWLLGEFRRQATGAAPVPWTGHD
ncbi:hypothetical protein GCM10027076_08820 [Nocardioides montaniterrae]